MEGYLKTKSKEANWVETNGWVIFKGLDAKSRIILTKADGASILINDAKQIKQKGKISGDLENILVGFSGSAMADPSDVVFAGNNKFSVKLKGINLGTVISMDMKMVLVNSLNGVLAGNNVKGIKIMAQNGDIMGTIGRRVKIGLPEVPTTVKIIKAKNGSIGFLDLMDSWPVKIGHGKVISKGAIDCCTILYDPAVWGDLCGNNPPPWSPIPFLK